MGALSPWHLLILAAVVVLFFGSKRMPDAARSLGRSMRILKAETRELRDDAPSAPRTPNAAPVATPPPVPDDVASPLPEAHRKTPAPPEA